MNDAAARAVYRRRLPDVVVIRRFSGPRGPERVATDYSARGHVKGTMPEALVGDVMQQTGHVVVNVEDLGAAGLALPITTADKVVVGGRELAISLVDSWTHTVAGALRAYRLTVKG